MCLSVCVSVCVVCVVCVAVAVAVFDVTTGDGTLYFWDTSSIIS